MKLSALVFATTTVSYVAATGPMAPLCLAACTPLLINPIAYAACAAGCAALGVAGEDTGNVPVIQADGNIAFKKESPECAEACKKLTADQLAYSACLHGCEGRPDALKK